MTRLWNDYIAKKIDEVKEYSAINLDLDKSIFIVRDINKNWSIHYRPEVIIGILDELKRKYTLITDKYMAERKWAKLTICRKLYKKRKYNVLCTIISHFNKEWANYMRKVDNAKMLTMENLELFYHVL